MNEGKAGLRMITDQPFSEAEYVALAQFTAAGGDERTGF